MKGIRHCRDCFVSEEVFTSAVSTAVVFASGLLLLDVSFKLLAGASASCLLLRGRSLKSIVKI